MSTWSILTSWNQGGIITTSCTLILTALILYHGIALVQHMTSKPTEREKKSSLLQRQMTPIGKFALLSQTKCNPSIISFFVALANKDEGMGIEEFEQLWTKVMKKHERFRFLVSQADGCFEEANKSLGEYTLELPHPQNPSEFKARIDKFLTSPMDLSEQMWEVCISSGPVGASGAILNSEDLIEQGYKSETVALFRSHHVLCDGVSWSAVVKDSADEHDQLDELMLDALEKYKMHAQNVGVLHRLVGLVMYYVFGSIFALSLQLWNMFTSTNPFDEFIKDPKDKDNKRSVSWKYLATIDDAKSVTKSISSDLKLNDLFIALLSSALEKQYQELKAKSDVSKTSSKCPSSVRVVVPVHLTGAILPGQTIGNKIGAFVASIPFNASPQKKQTNSLSRLRKISRILSRIKRTPAPQISWFITALISTLGLESIAKYAMVRCHCHAAAVVSNVHGFPFQIHWKGRPIEIICAFLPLPPQIPIGVLVTSYDGKIVVSVEADEQVVPDADRFLDYILEEYEVIKEEISREGEATDA